jgi:hypothetical protein
MAQFAVDWHGGTTRQVIRPKALPLCAWHDEPAGQSAEVAHVWRAPAGHAVMQALMAFVPASTVAVGK